MKRFLSLSIITFLLLCAGIASAMAQVKKEVQFRITVLKTTGDPQPGMILKVVGQTDKYVGDAQGVISFKLELEKDMFRSASLYFPSDENRSVSFMTLNEKETSKTYYIDSPEDLLAYKQKNTTIEVEGIIKDTAGKPVANAIISVQGTGRKATSDEAGLFKIAADYNHPITLRADGMENQSLAISRFLQNPEEAYRITMFRKNASKIYSVVDKMPEFPGGMKAFQNYLNRHLKYPAQAKKEKKEGVVVVQFIVEPNGNISSPTVMRGLEATMDSAAIAAIRTMPKWNPGEDNGMSVRCKYSVPVQFKITSPKENKAAQRQAEMQKRAAEMAQLKENIRRLCGEPEKRSLLSYATVPTSPDDRIEIKIPLAVEKSHTKSKK